MEQTDGSNDLYRLGGFTALVMIALVILDIGISIAMPEESTTHTVIEWFNLFNDNALKASRELGILNVLNAVLGIPVIYSLYIAHYHVHRTYAGLALMLSLLGGAIYISSNAVLPMLDLSHRYLNAAEADHPTLVAAGEALLTRGADFTPGSLPGFVIQSLASILIAYVMLRGAVFSRITAYSGLIGYTLLLIFTIWITLIPEAFNTAMILAFPGGIFVLIWQFLIMRRLFQLAKK